uniref:Reverse transcriptase domain-containing protein n=1 Tax=Tanacetum cinerariifolium TaxID=118510 RepID=A0A6L2KDK6_TANCI|nr:reverse transcriptase domain-containing protein [Tanacetum cinerariifolium]
MGHAHAHVLIGSARVSFDKLPPESVDIYESLRKAFLGNFSQQKKYIKDHVEIQHIKQKEGESTEAFMERFKAESMHVNGAPECMRISGFMHGITNPDLTKRLNDNIPEFVDEMVKVTTAFLRGEVAAANRSRKKSPPSWKHHESDYSEGQENPMVIEAEIGGHLIHRMHHLSHQSMEINGVKPPVNHREPPLDHRSSAAEAPPDHWSTIGQRWSTVDQRSGRIRIGSGSVVAPPEWATWHPVKIL